MEDKSDKRIEALEKQVKAQQEIIDEMRPKVIVLDRLVYRLMHPYAPNDPRPAHIVDLNR